MSRIGKQVISIPEKVAVTRQDDRLIVAGPLGTVRKIFKPSIVIIIKDKNITLEPQEETGETKALWGTYASHIKNMILGVIKGYEKKLTIEGIGYKVAVSGNKVVLDIGYSHSVDIPIPEGIKVAVEKNNFSVSGVDKEQVGEFAAKLRAHKKTEPYKGKGIRYIDEIVRRKQGKKTVG